MFAWRTPRDFILASLTLLSLETRLSKTQPNLSFDKLIHKSGTLTEITPTKLGKLGQIGIYSALLYVNRGMAGSERGSGVHLLPLGAPRPLPFIAPRSEWLLSCLSPSRFFCAAVFRVSLRVSVS